MPAGATCPLPIMKSRPRRVHIALLCSALALLPVCVVYASTELRLRRVYTVPAVTLDVPTDAASIERGQHLVQVIAQCTNCHGEDLGGRSLGENPWLGRLSAPNLTPGRGGIGSHSNEELVWSIRYGVGRDRRPLVMMPAQYLRKLGDKDLGAIVAYLRSLAPVDREVEGVRAGPLARLLLFLDRLPDVVPAETVIRAGEPAPPPRPGLSIEYGGYLVDTAGCRICHRHDLSGGLHPLALPGEPRPPGLTPDGPLATWSERDFLHTLRTGTTPDGRRLDDAYMPWRRIGRMSDPELKAIWRYLRSLEAARIG